jgi:23S rRNA (cytosine1962-C5)-methyltransferase
VERPSLPAGMVPVVGPRGQPVGLALWSPSSEISLRMLTRDLTDPGGRFWRDRIERAVSRRAESRRAVSGGAESRRAESRRAVSGGAESGRVESHRAGLGGTAWRAVHAEADGLPSLVVDVLADVVVVQLLSAGLERYRSEVVEALRAVLSPRGLLARNDVPVREREALPVATELLWGEVPEQVEVEEAGVRYLAAPWTGQKTGAFLDQRENRVVAGRLAEGRRRALDAFCYHGSFALHMARGAGEVLALDASADALARARENLALNGYTNVELEEDNAFDRLRGLESAGERFDVVVLDPPAFAKHRSTVERALRGYKEINLRGMRVLAPGGHLLTFSCSYHISTEAFRGMLAAAAADSGRTIRWVRSLGQAEDHPVILQIPETGYLKGAVLQALD